MALEKFDKLLKLMVLLTQNRLYSVSDISRMLQLNLRSVYRYIELLRESGFVVVKEGTKYRLDPSSPFFREITELIHFTEEEALTINSVLNSVIDNSPQVRRLREKLSSLYDFNVLARHGIDNQVARNLSALYRAVKEERVAILREYTSPSSQKTADRYVEPYLFLSGNTEVRCFEITTGMNKTFNIGRARGVEVVDLRWSNKEKHAPMYTDLFRFSGEERKRVQMLLGPLATSLLLEEYPAAEDCLSLQSDGRQLLDTEVCSFKGVGRFYMGLNDDIELVDSPEFEAYLRERIKDLTKKARL